MRKQRFSEEQIIAAIKQMEGGRPAADIAREIGVSKRTIYAWNQKYGGMSGDDAKKLRQLEEENRRLKHLVADLTLDREALKLSNVLKSLEGGSPETMVSNNRS